MLIADIKGKLSLREEYSEDFLTSAVFSTFMYLDEKWIQKYINQAVNLRGKNLSTELKNPRFDFWPYFAPIKETKMGTEPDVVIYSGNTAIIVEAKNYSGKSGEGIIGEDFTENSEGIDTKQIADQLGREYFIGMRSILESSKVINEVVFHIDDFVLIFLTRHPIFPENEIEDSINTIAKINPKEKVNAEEKIYWLNWQKAVPIFEEIVETKPENTFEYKISKDMVDFLDRRDLGRFLGFDFLDKFHSFIGESKKAFSWKYLFYKKEFKPYWMFLDKLKSDIQISKDAVFYKQEFKPYWMFLEKLESDIQISKNTVFYNIISLPYWNFIKNDFKFIKGSIFYTMVEKPYWEFITQGFDFEIEKEIFYKE